MQFLVTEMDRDGKPVDVIFYGKDATVMRVAIMDALAAGKGVALFREEGVRDFCQRYDTANGELDEAEKMIARIIMRDGSINGLQEYEIRRQYSRNSHVRG
jgi:hypothetical protein